MNNNLLEMDENKQLRALIEKMHVRLLHIERDRGERDKVLISVEAIKNDLIRARASGLI